MRFHEFDLNHLSEWPLWLRMCVTVLCGAWIVFLGYAMDLKNAFATLEDTVVKQDQLLKTLSLKQQESSLLNAYTEHMQNLHQQFEVLMRQFGKHTEMPQLIEVISKHAVLQGLDLKNITLKNEKLNDFYIELPIEIEVSSDFHHIAHFISEIENLPHMIAIDDFTIENTAFSKATESLMMLFTATILQEKK